MIEQRERCRFDGSFMQTGFIFARPVVIFLRKKFLKTKNLEIPIQYFENSKREILCAQKLDNLGKRIVADLSELNMLG